MTVGERAVDAASSRATRWPIDRADQQRLDDSRNPPNRWYTLDGLAPLAGRVLDAGAEHATVGEAAQRGVEQRRRIPLLRVPAIGWDTSRPAGRVALVTGGFAWHRPGRGAAALAADWQRLLRTNVDGPYAVAQAVVPAMRAQGVRADSHGFGHVAVPAITFFGSAANIAVTGELGRVSGGLCRQRRTSATIAARRSF